MKEKSIFAQVFGTRNKQPQCNRETQKSETPKTDAPCVDEAKRNADFWNSVNKNMGDAHSAAALISMQPCPMYEGADRRAYQKAVFFASLITSDNGAMERAKAKYHTDDLYQIYRKVSMEDLF
ncbi:hypothetical protein EEL52_06335 [Muribaculaceae bacterium Isolate-113 (HZI)]|nr:hypothetical protein EEL53_13175 [Muribaculaceae bacterium Isolate-114 (HZI)]ROT22732.1 hypothetical protein EEL52_06335 [Muribaculaceae bacterium Isolate-113 (HZI)]